MPKRPSKLLAVGSGEASTKLLINSSHQARESISRGREKCSVLENEAEKIPHLQEHRLSILYQTARQGPMCVTSSVITMALGGW